MLPLGIKALQFEKAIRLLQVRRLINSTIRTCTKKAVALADQKDRWSHSRFILALFMLEGHIRLPGNLSTPQSVATEENDCKMLKTNLSGGVFDLRRNTSPKRDAVM